MSGFRVAAVRPFEEVKPELLEKGLFVLLIGATQIPPHIAMMIHGGIYSLSVKGKKRNVSSNKYLKALKAKGTQILLIEIVPKVTDNAELLTSLNATFNSAPTLGNGVATCLWPVKSFCSDIFYENFYNVKYVFDLIPKLDRIQGLGAAYHINMENDLDDEGGFKLLVYSMDDIQERLSSLV